jgi:hypothetical protein
MRFLEQNRYAEQNVKKCKKSLPIFELAGNIRFVSPGEGSRPSTLSRMARLSRAVGNSI